MKQEDLIPADPNRCQAEKPNGVNAFTLGGAPEMIRCSSKPSVIITEIEPAKDGLKGSMSLCDECLTVAEKQLNIEIFTVARLKTDN